MQRRKFVVGLGSLAAGASVTMGTGALSSTEAKRHLSGKVVADSRAYVNLTPMEDGNGQYVSTMKGGELALDFGDIGSSADGLNANAKSYFDNVFEVTVPQAALDGGPGEYSVWFTVADAVVDGRLTFYRGDARDSNPLNGSAQADSTRNDGDGNATIPIGVCIDLNGTGDRGRVGETLPEAVCGGEDPGSEDLFHIHVDNSA